MIQGHCTDPGTLHSPGDTAVPRGHSTAPGDTAQLLGTLHSPRDTAQPPPCLLLLPGRSSSPGQGLSRAGVTPELPTPTTPPGIVPSVTPPCAIGVCNTFPPVPVPPSCSQQAPPARLAPQWHLLTGMCLSPGLRGQTRHVTPPAIGTDACPPAGTARFWGEGGGQWTPLSKPRQPRAGHGRGPIPSRHWQPVAPRRARSDPDKSSPSAAKSLLK